uniref:Uncharacterized protein n=1 Tax=Microcebus murinus TaxID=30608 RepID=A0A8C5W502_MICMU
IGECLLTSRLLSSSPSLSSNRLSVEAQTPLFLMGDCQVGHNLHLCLAHHPPLICATLILLLLGLSGLGLGSFLHTHRTGLCSPDIPQDWLTLCPVNGIVTGKWQGSHVVGLLTTLNFAEGPDRNKTQTFQTKILGGQMGLKGSSAGQQVLITARVTRILPSSQPPISCSEEGAGNATLSPKMGEDYVRVWSHKGLVLTKLLTSEELALCGSRLLSHWSRTRL